MSGASSGDKQLIDALYRLAQHPSARNVAEVGFSDRVALGAASRVVQRVRVGDLDDTSSWRLQLKPFRGRIAGAYSALRLLRMSHGSYRVTSGEHRHCAGAAVPAPAPLRDLRRVSAQAVGTSTCLDWWTVDAFVDADGLVRGVTLDLWEP